MSIGGLYIPPLDKIAPHLKRLRLERVSCRDHNLSGLVRVSFESLLGLNGGRTTGAQNK